MEVGEHSTHRKIVLRHCPSPSVAVRGTSLERAENIAALAPVPIRGKQKAPVTGITGAFVYHGWQAETDFGDSIMRVDS